MLFIGMFIVQYISFSKDVHLIQVKASIDCAVHSNPVGRLPLLFSKYLVAINTSLMELHTLKV